MLSINPSWSQSTVSDNNNRIKRTPRLFFSSLLFLSLTHFSYLSPLFPLIPHTHTMKSITIVALSTLALASQATAQIISYSAPIAATQWT
jgi:hypothetical protein